MSDGSASEPFESDRMHHSPQGMKKRGEQLLLFYTGEARDASAVLADQDERTKSGDQEMLENMHRTKEMGLQSRDLLRSGDLFAYAELMHEHWLNKRKRSPGMATDRIDELYTLAHYWTGWSLRFNHSRRPLARALAFASACQVPSNSQTFWPRSSVK